MMKRVFLVLAILAAGLVAPSLAVQPDEILKDPALEARARNISAGLRCLVCQNQSIDDSNAAVARDLRVLIREQLTQNKTDEQVVDFVVERYGEFVLLKPRFELSTLVLWLAPFLALAAGLAYAVSGMRKPAKPAAPEALSEAEKDELEALLKKDG